MEDKLVEGQAALDKLKARLKEAAIARHTELRMD
jgi:hypothetical protein